MLVVSEIDQQYQNDTLSNRLSDFGEDGGYIKLPIHRLLECLSLRRNWFFPSPPLQASVSLPPLDPKGGEQQLLAGEGVGVPNSATSQKA